MVHGTRVGSRRRPDEWDSGSLGPHADMPWLRSAAGGLLMNAWQRLWDSDVPFSRRLYGLWVTIRCYLGHDAHWVPSYHINRVYSPLDEYAIPASLGPDGRTVVGYRFRCRRCNRDLYWGTPPDDSLDKERSR